MGKPSEDRFQDEGPEDFRLNRRGFIRQTGDGILILSSLSWFPMSFAGESAAAPPEATTYVFRGDPELLGRGAVWLHLRRKLKALNREQFLLLEELVDVIIPEDEQPGAKSVGVAHFIDWELADSLPDERNRFLHGLERAEDSSQAVFQKKFRELDEPEKIRLCADLEGGKIHPPVWKGSSSREFFTNLKRWTVKGYYSCPAVWEHIRYPGPSMWIGYPEISASKFEF